MQCPWCGQQVAPAATTCPNCGSRLRTAPLTQCPYCKTKIERHLTLCPHCGREQRQGTRWRVIAGATLGTLSVMAILGFFVLPALLRSLQTPTTIPIATKAQPSPTVSPVSPTALPPTFTPTSTPRPATPTPTPTPTAMATSTSTPTPLSPSATTAIETSTPTPTPGTPSPTPLGAFKYPRPELWGPPDWLAFQGRDAEIDLTWSGVPTGVLAEGEWYGLSVRFTGLDGQTVYGASRWLKEPQWHFPSEYYEQISWSERSIFWDVRVVRQTTNPDGSAGGTDISPISETRVLFWR